MTEALRRELGPYDAIAVVVGAIVGVGIFFTPSRVAALAGSDSLFLITWGVGGLVAIAGAMTFAELGGLYPRTGGQYDILRDAYGPAIGFVYVTCNATATQAGAIGIIAIVCVQNAAVALAGHSLEGGSLLGAALAVSFVIACANAAGVRQGARIQNATVVAKVGALIAVVVIALLFHEPAPATATSEPTEYGPLAAIAAGLVPVLFSFGGWQMALWVGGEVRDPQRNVPRAIMVGVAIVVVVYLGANWAYLRLLGHAGVASSEALAADAVTAAVGDVGRRLVAAAVAVSALGVLNAQLLGGPRLLLALARDGRFFRPFASVHPRSGTPIPAIALLCGTAMILLVAAGADGIDRLLTGVVLIDAVFFLLTGLATLVLLRRHPRAGRPVRMPWFPLVPLFFVLAEGGAAVGAWMDPNVRGAAVIGIGWIAAASVIYALWFRQPADPPDKT
ncbi:MAG: amino acid permease [Myxococcota bacterium]